MRLGDNATSDHENIANAIVSLSASRTSSSPTDHALARGMLLTIASASEIRVVSAGTSGDAFLMQTLGEPCFESRRSLTWGELGSGGSGVTSPERVKERSEAFMRLTARACRRVLVSRLFPGSDVGHDVDIGLGASAR